MKFKLREKFDETRRMIQDYMYDAIDELNNASLEEYIKWFKDNLTSYPEDIEQAITDAYIEACDYGMIKGVEKTRITSELKDYIESHTDIIDDTEELMRQCPGHLQHELKIVLSKLDESLNESLLDDTHYWNSSYDHAVFKYINENPDLVDDIETLYQQCSKYLKPSLVKILDHAGVVPSLSVKRAQYLLQAYDPLVLMNVIRDRDATFRGNNAFDALEYGVKYWDNLFSDVILNESLTESVLEEALRPDLKRFIEQHAELLDENNIEELYKQCPRELKIPLVRMLNAASLDDNIETIKRATFLADFYDDEELINLVLSVGEHANDVFDAFDYIMNNWDEFFTDIELNASLTEASNSVTKAFSDKVISGHTSNVRGSDIISDAILDKYNMRKLSSNQHYVIHHRDGNHKNTDQGNEFIMSNTDHGRIHKLVRNRIQSEYFDKLEDQKILDYIAHLKQVETFVKKLKSVCIEAGIDDNKIIFEAPLPDNTDAVERYNDLIKPDNDAIKKINCEVFDDFFAEHQFLGKGKKNVRIAEYSRTQEPLVNNN